MYVCARLFSVTKGDGFDFSHWRFSRSKVEMEFISSIKKIPQLCRFNSKWVFKVCCYMTERCDFLFSAGTVAFIPCRPSGVVKTYKNSIYCNRYVVVSIFSIFIEADQSVSRIGGLIQTGHFFTLFRVSTMFCIFFKSRYFIRLKAEQFRCKDDSEARLQQWFHILPGKGSI